MKDKERQINGICYEILNKLMRLIFENKDLIYVEEIDEITKNIYKAINCALNNQFTIEECNTIIDNANFTAGQILAFKDTKRSGIKESIKNHLRSLYLYLSVILNHSSKFTIDAYNSSNYYQNRINDLTKTKTDLELEINKLLNQKQTENTEKSILLKEKEKKLTELAKQIEILNAQLNEANQLNEAKTVRKSTITDTFTRLSKDLEPIKNEHERLEKQYKIFFKFSIFLVVLLLIIELILYCKNWDVSLTWEKYIALIIPIPIFLGLLWGFITQMNKAQRQMVILAKQIHEVRYVEGLLLAFNSLSVNTSESFKEFNIIIKKMIDNHLKYDFEPLKNEDILKNESQKDTMPIETIENILKGVRDIYKATK